MSATLVAPKKKFILFIFFYKTIFVNQQYFAFVDIQVGWKVRIQSQFIHFVVLVGMITYFTV